MKYILFLIILFILLVIFSLTSKSGFLNYVAPYNNVSQKYWWSKQGWERFGYPYYSFWESFQNNAEETAKMVKKQEKNKIDEEKKDTEDLLFAYPPNGPAPAKLSINKPYHLLSDEFQPPRQTEALSCVNSRSCYATDFQRAIEKTGDFRQFTNNYKRGKPDSCSAPYQELVLNFYKADLIPYNN